MHSPVMLLQYLHDTGAVFYNKEYFPDTIILDQSWALEAVYSLFDRDAAFRVLTKLRGRFSQDILAELVWQDYDEKEQSLFIHLMQSCGICFQVKKAVPRIDISAEYIAPDLLPQRSAIEEDLAQRRWNPDKHDFELRYRLPFLHFGVIRGLISAIGNLAVEAGIYWKDGVWVYEKQTNASAIISQQRDANSESSGAIVVQVQGPGSEALTRKLAAWIRSRTSLRDQTPTILRAGEELPESEFEHYLSPGKQTSLIKSEHHKKGAPEIDAEEKSVEQPVELHFAENISASPEKTEVFISYAWGVQEDLIDDLCSQLNHQDIKVIRDKTDLNSGDRISKFMQRLAMGHYIILVISQKYVQSHYCMNELYGIYRNCGADADKFINKVIPLITSDACIDNLSDRMKAGIYWKRQHEKLIPLIKELGADNIGEEEFKEYKNIGDFAMHVTRILSLVKDKLISRDFEKASQDGFAEIVSLINKT